MGWKPLSKVRCRSTTSGRVDEDECPSTHFIHNPIPRYSDVAVTSSEFAAKTKSSIGETAAARVSSDWCFDFKLWNERLIMFNNAIDVSPYMPRVYAAFALAGVPYMGRNWRDMQCSEVAHLCDDFDGVVGNAVRYVCPVTCGHSRYGLRSELEKMN